MKIVERNVYFLVTFFFWTHIVLGLSNEVCPLAYLSVCDNECWPLLRKLYPTNLSHTSFAQLSIYLHFLLISNNTFLLIGISTVVFHTFIFVYQTLQSPIKSFIFHAIRFWLDIFLLKLLHFKYFYKSFIGVKGERGRVREAKTDYQRPQTVFFKPNKRLVPNLNFHSIEWQLTIIHKKD